MGKAKRERGERGNWYDRAVLLTGLMGSGKSSVGRMLAEDLAWSFIDTDLRVEELRGLPVAEIFAREGEAAFRKLERQVLEALPEGRAVVALGGGAVLSDENRRLLAAKGTRIWLDARPETLLARLGAAEGRPLLEGMDERGRLARLRELARARASAYAEADLRVPTDGLSTREVCARVTKALEGGHAA